MTTNVLQWGLARSIRNAKMLEGELEEESMLERLENEVGKEKSKCRYFPAGGSMISSVGKQKLRPTDLLPKGYRGIPFKDWLELIVKASASLNIADHISLPRVVCDVLDC